MFEIPGLKNNIPQDDGHFLLRIVFPCLGFSDMPS